MSFTESLLKNLLISSSTKKVLKLPERSSPLFLNFERWAGKKRRLYMESTGEVYEHLNNIGKKIPNNLFAKLLASPIRCERMSDIKLPKELLIQSKIDNSGNVKFTFKQSKEGKNSYVLNKSQFLNLKMKSSKSIMPLHLLSSGFLGKQLALTTFNKQTTLLSYLEEMKHDLLEQISELRKERSIMSDKSNIHLIYDEKNTNAIEIKKNKENNLCGYMIQLNLGILKESKWNDLIKKVGDSGVYLNLESDVRLVNTLYKLIVFLA